MTHRIGKLVATGVVRHVGRRIAGTRLARASVRAGTGPGAAARILDFDPPLPIDGPDPLAAAAAGDARRRNRRCCPTCRMRDIARVLRRPRWIGTLTSRAAIRAMQSPRQAAAHHDRLPETPIAWVLFGGATAQGPCCRRCNRIAGVSRRVGIQRGCCPLLGCGRAAD